MWQVAAAAAGLARGRRRLHAWAAQRRCCWALGCCWRPWRRWDRCFMPGTDSKRLTAIHSGEHRHVGQ